MAIGVGTIAMGLEEREMKLDATVNAAWQEGIYRGKTGWESVDGRLLRRYI